MFWNSINRKNKVGDTIEKDVETGKTKTKPKYVTVTLSPYSNTLDCGPHTYSRRNPQQHERDDVEEGRRMGEGHSRPVL